MANTVKIKRSAVPGKVPAVGDLSLGELAINTYDGKLYTKKDVSGAESVVLLGGGELLASNNLSDVANAGTARTNLGLAIGTNVQAYDAGLQSIAGLTTAADRMIYTTASDTYAVTTLTAFGRSIIDDADATAARTTLGLGTSAIVNTGTSGATIPLLNAANTWSADQTISSTAPGLVFNETDAAVDNTLWRIRANASTFILTTLDKDGLNPNTALSIGRSGVSIGAVAISGSALTFNANTVWHAGNTHTHAAGDVTSGTFADARIPSLDTSKITTGVMATARLGTGTANSTTYLRGDGTWATVAGGSGDMLKSENLSGLANYTTARSNLGLGTAATVNTGTSGATIPLLNGANIHSGRFISSGGPTTTPAAGAHSNAFQVSNSDTAYGMLFGVNSATGAGFIQSQRVDGTATTYGLSLNPNGGTVNTGGALNIGTQVTINGTSTTNTVAINGRLNLTTDLGVVRSTIDWGYSQTGLTIYNNDNTPITFGTAGVARMNISGTGAITLGTQAPQSTALAGMRANGNNFEWGHTNTAGYHGTLGSFSGAGDPYISFNAEHGTNSNTFRTRGRFGGVIYIAGGDGRMHFGHLANHTADNQTLAIGLTLDINGNLGLGTTSPTNFGAGWRALTIGESGKNGVVRLTSGTVTADMFTDTSALFIRTATNHSIVFRTNDADRATITSAGLQLSDLGPTSEFAAGFRGTPVNRQDSSYTLVLTDAGKTILKGTNTASQTYTIPANGSVAYPVGTILTFANLGNVAMSIAITTDPMYLSPGGSTGTRTLAGFGMATAVKVTSTNWMISGVGLT